MKRRTVFVLALVCTTVLAAAVPSLGLGQPVHGVKVVDGPYATDFCGVLGTAVDTFTFNVRDDGVDALINENESQVFTASATGRSIEASSSGTFKGHLEDNGDGDLTFSEKDAGLSLQLKILNGATLKAADGKPLIGAGTLSVTVTVDSVTGDVVSFDESWNGPHPLRDGVDICAPVVSYLTGS
jgi:hypothetical protein